MYVQELKYLLVEESLAIVSNGFTLWLDDDKSWQLLDLILLVQSVFALSDDAELKSFLKVLAQSFVDERSAFLGIRE
jgi:hypothetical protein